MSLRRLASRVIRRPSRILTEINANALLVEWTAAHPAQRQLDSREALYALVNDQLGGAPVDYLEFGVWKGDSILEWARLNPHPDSRFVGFDSFEGLPENWSTVTNAMPKGMFSTDGALPQTDDPRISFVKGWFNQTLPGFMAEWTPRSRLVVHIDADLYSSTLYCLTMLDRWLSPPALLMFDEFFCSSHEFQAYYDWARAYGREHRVVGAVGVDPYLQVALAGA